MLAAASGGSSILFAARFTRLGALTLILTRAGLAMDLDALRRLRFVATRSQRSELENPVVVVVKIHPQMGQLCRCGWFDLNPEGQFPKPSRLKHTQTMLSIFYRFHPWVNVVQAIGF